VLYFLAAEGHSLSSGPIHFDEFELDCQRFELVRAGRTLKLEKLPMELLILLVEKSDHLVTRDEIVERLWGGDVFLDTEHGINTAIRKIRNALRDDPNQPRFVQTVTGKGYRFIAPVTVPVQNSANHATASVAETKDHDTEEVKAGPAPLTLEPAQPPTAMVRRFSWPLVLIAVAVFLIAFAVYFRVLRPRWFAAAAHPPIQSLAVLPMENLSGDPAQDYFADGMTDELITMLAKSTRLRIISRTSVMQYKKAQRPLRDIARELRVDGILEGSVERSDGKVHVNVQLIYAPGDQHLWAESYDRDLRDIGTLQRDLAQTIARQVGLTVSSAATKDKKINPEARDAYFMGRYYWFAEDYENCQKFLQKAIDLQPDYAAAWAGIADAYMGAAASGEVRGADVMSRAEEAARKALSLDDSAPEAHHAMTAAYFFHRWDLQSAEQESARTLALDPNLAEAHHLRSYILMAMNRTDEALQEQKRATELDPFARPWALSNAFLTARQYDLALKEAKLRSEARPADASLHGQLSEIYRLLGRDKEAALEWETALRVSGRQQSAERLQNAFEKGGLPGVYRWKLDFMKQSAAKAWVSPLEFAGTFACMGNKDDAIRYLEKSYQEHEPWLVNLQTDPKFDALHSDPRYQAIVQKMGLPPAYK
jgi:TolB-like protein/DNA-binding winged helix-turn-helix (wHTH) protein